MNSWILWAWGRVSETLTAWGVLQMVKAPNWIVGALTGGITGSIAAFQGYGLLAILFVILIGFAVGTFTTAQISPLEARDPSKDQQTKEQLQELFKSVADPAYHQAHKLLDQIKRKLLETRNEDTKQTVGILLNRFIIEVIGALTGGIMGLVAALQGYGLLAILFAILIGFAIGIFITSQISPLEARSPGEDQQMREQLEELFKSAADPAYNEAHRLLSQITRTLLETSDDNSKQTVGILLNRFIMEADRAARTQLGAALKSNASPTADPEHLQYLFGDYYEKYQWIVEWIHRGGLLIDFPFKYDPNYRKWRDEDTKFLRKFRDTIACTEFFQLRQRFNRVGWGEEFRNRHRPGD